MFRNTIIFFLLTTITNFNLFTKDYESKEINVIEEKYRSDNKLQGRTVRIITDQEINELFPNPISLTEVLIYLSEIEVQTKGPFGLQDNFSIRGASFNQLLVMMDGARLNDPLTGHFSGNFPVNIHDIQQIEIIKGSQAAKYGPGATGGVINIVTKSFNRNRDLDHNPIIASALIGEFNTYNYRINVDASISDNFSFGGNVDYIQSDGHDFYNYINSPMDKGIYSVFASYENEESELKLKYIKNNRNLKTRYYYTNSPFDFSREKVNQDNLIVSSKTKLFENDLQLIFNLLSTDDEFIFSPDFPSRNFNQMNSYNLNLFYDFNINDISITFGFNSINNSMKSIDRGDRFNSINGAYLTASYMISNKLISNIGVRLDNNNIFGNEISPHFGLDYYISDKLKLNFYAGKSVRAADFTELYVNTGIRDTIIPGRNLGNVNLKAERSHNFEIGINYDINPSDYFNFSTFVRQSNNLIDFTLRKGSEIETENLIIPDADYFFADNILSLYNYGLELSFAKTLINTETQKLRAIFSYTYIQSDTEDEKISKYVANHSGHLLSLNLLYNISNFQVGLSGLYKDRDSDEAQAINSQLIASYFLMNSYLRYKVDSKLPVLKNIELLSLELYNIFDIEYSDILGVQMLPRYLSFSILFKI